MCRILATPHSSYYKWLKVRDNVNQEDQEIQNKIKNYHELFNHILGYRRMTLWLNIIGKKNYNVKRIRRHMKLLHIASAIRRKKTNYLRYKPEQVGENVLERQFSATKPNEKWLTDVTEFKIIGSTKKLYLSAILDLYDVSVKQRMT